MNHITWIGYAAGACTTLAYIPQLLKVLQTRSTDDISLRMMFVLSTGLALWTTYGFLLDEIPIIVANAASLFMASSIIALKLRFG